MIGIDHGPAPVYVVFSGRLQMRTLQNAKQLLLPRLDAARSAWLLLAACHNLRKLHGHIGVIGLVALPAS